MRTYSDRPLEADVAAPHAVEPAPTAPSPPSGHDVRSIAEAALLMDVTVLLVLLRVLVPIPFFQGLLRLACPLPFILLTLRRGSRIGLLATIASYLLLSCFVGPVLATQELVFGGLGVLFAWASQRRINSTVTILTGALLYGVLYLLLPFLLGLLALRVNLGRTLSDVHKQAGSYLTTVGHLHFYGLAILVGVVVIYGVLALVFRSFDYPSGILVLLPVGVLGLILPVGPSVVATLSRIAAGRAVLSALHGLALIPLTHPLAALVAFFALYSLINVWAYLVIGVELFHRLPDETRRDPWGGELDFFPGRHI